VGVRLAMLVWLDLAFSYLVPFPAGISLEFGPVHDKFIPCWWSKLKQAQSVWSNRHLRGPRKC
jgi:hypothetical protein